MIEQQETESSENEIRLEDLKRIMNEAPQGTILNVSIQIIKDE